MDVLRTLTEHALEREPVKPERNITKEERLKIIWSWVDLKHISEP